MAKYKVELKWTGCKVYETRIVEAESQEAIERKPQLALEGELIDEKYEYVRAYYHIIGIERDSP